jgi:hypothetical protein
MQTIYFLHHVGGVVSKAWKDGKKNQVTKNTSRYQPNQYDCVARRL